MVAQKTYAHERTITVEGRRYYVRDSLRGHAMVSGGMFVVPTPLAAKLNDSPFKLRLAIRVAEDKLGRLAKPTTL